MNSRTWLCGHRGAAGIVPENTVAAVHRARELGAGMVEVDLQLTRDGHFVLFHDTDLERTSTGQGPLHARTLAELRSLDAGSWFAGDFRGERIPTLHELLAVTRGSLRLNLELKGHGQEVDWAERVARRVEGEELADWCLLTSFDHDLMAQLGRLLPAEWKLGLIVGAADWRDDLLERPETVLSIHQRLATGERLARIRQAGKEAHVWTVDDPVRWRELRGAGAEVIITNHPEFEADEKRPAE